MQHSPDRGARRQREREETGNLSENIVKENFPNLVKEVDMQRVPSMMDAKRPTPRHNIIKRSKVKEKERLLKAAREKKLVTR